MARKKKTEQKGSKFFDFLMSIYSIFMLFVLAIGLGLLIWFSKDIIKIFTEQPKQPRIETPAKSKEPKKDPSKKSPPSGKETASQQKEKAAPPPEKAQPGDVKFPIDSGLRKGTQETNGHLYGGYPVSRRGDKVTILKNLGYTVGYSEKYCCPLWVGYKYVEKPGKNTLKRKNNFRTDKRTISKIKTSDYTRSGYDRGHMAPNSGIAFRFGSDGQSETFLMSNIVPQTPQLNRKIWQRLEAYENDAANNLEAVWVITGPIFGPYPNYIKNKIAIPEAFYKILADEDTGKLRTVSFIIPQNVGGNEPLEQFLTSIHEIESRTGLDFFSPMYDENEKRLEIFKAKRLWSF